MKTVLPYGHIHLIIYVAENKILFKVFDSVFKYSKTFNSRKIINNFNTYNELEHDKINPQRDNRSHESG